MLMDLQSNNIALLIGYSFSIVTKYDLEKVFFAENKIAKNPIFDTFGTRKKCAIS